MPNTLIASLGQSPAVITETLDHLRDVGTNDGKKIIFDRLVIIAPGQLPLAQSIKEAEFLEQAKDFPVLESSPTNPQYPSQVIWSFDNGYLTDLDDIRTEEDAVAFFDAALELTKNYGYGDVYYAIAGGRKSMSALMVLAAQHLPVKGIFHILLNDLSKIKSEIALELRDDETLLELLAEVEDSDAEDLHEAFHPGAELTKLVEIPFKQSFDSEIVKAVDSERKKHGKLAKLDDVRKAIYKYFIDNPQHQPPSCNNQKFDTSPKRLWHETSSLTDPERKLTKEISDELMKAIPQICETEHHIGGNKHKENKDNLHRYDWGIHKDGKSSRFETMFPVSSNPPLRVRLHLITTATSKKQMEFLWQKIEEFCGKPTKSPPAVLISTLGESPGVVTSAVHFYEKVRQEPIRFEEVVVIGPDNDDIRLNCYDLLQRQPCLENRLSYEKFDAYDVREQKDLTAFLDKTERVVRKYVDDGYQIYLNLAGGRKVMSGALLHIAQLCPVQKAFHLSILDDDSDQAIEQYGEWRKLNALKHDDPEKYQRILYPDKLTAVGLPISQYAGQLTESGA